jgi:hypothetical protein
VTESHYSKCGYNASVEKEKIMKKLLILLVIVGIAFTNSITCMATEPTSKEILTDFKNKIAEFVGSY